MNNIKLKMISMLFLSSVSSAALAGELVVLNCSGINRTTIAGTGGKFNDMKISVQYELNFTSKTYIQTTLVMNGSSKVIRPIVSEFVIRGDEVELGDSHYFVNMKTSAWHADTEAYDHGMYFWMKTRGYCNEA